MIVANSKDFLQIPIEEYIISAEKVAHVQLGNNAEHALLVLTKTGYSSIPVLDVKYRLHGLISSQQITDEILGLEHIEYERLPELKVDDIMKTDVAVIHIKEKFQKGLDLLVNNPYICVIDDERTFLGILTRRVILKQMKKYLYQTQETQV
ncbi:MULTISPECIES: cyclic-di-AMP-binding protein CbpB [Psychrobacillus]|uniref:CBS domain-containing protein n=1 Tax=Psychrobacillus lasiicapitis TaxID=1636719 RepID=A0A544TEE7_9BACI|nr:MULTISPECIES: cyclic-di-AMP-binding protein CbpB [Psychrobacillus]MDI2589606.1 CBS domain-containing protein [Psychrobacillus sp. NEAU-3TGS]TQR15841.1 CBS domain-containing protein [Psychrobacillus lasiicapitis]GGA17641.1 CBS domain-containing protein [Psychrobacillus lasiicapitis]